MNLRAGSLGLDRVVFSRRRIADCFDSQSTPKRPRIHANSRVKDSRAKVLRSSRKSPKRIRPCLQKFSREFLRFIRKCAFGPPQDRSRSGTPSVMQPDSRNGERSWKQLSLEFTFRDVQKQRGYRAELGQMMYWMLSSPRGPHGDMPKTCRREFRNRPKLTHGD